jgi:hypothetical protein
MTHDMLRFFSHSLARGLLSLPVAYIPVSRDRNLVPSLLTTVSLGYIINYYARDGSRSAAAGTGTAPVGYLIPVPVPIF